MTASTPKARSASPMQAALRSLGLLRDIDLALHLPLRYEDETRVVRLVDIGRSAEAPQVGEAVQIEATVTRCDVAYRPRRQLLVVLTDDEGETCTLRFFHFFPSHQKTLAQGVRVRVRGEIQGGFGGWAMVHPAFRAASGELPKALTPIYPSTGALAQAYLRAAVLRALAAVDLPETVLPGAGEETSEKIGLLRAWSLRRSLQFLHQPTPDVGLATLSDRSHPAWQRLKAEELLAQQLSHLKARNRRDARRAPRLAADRPAEGTAADDLVQGLLQALPFQLTSAQRRVVGQITADLARPIPMHRLLQGDVGSGKTVVAALAAARCIDAGWQCALMAPTEILAEQHFRKLVEWLEPLLARRGQLVAWLTGGQRKRERDAARAAVADGRAALVVGTHAVIQDAVQFARLGLAIIDEQHRFGVAQRLALRGKAVAAPNAEVLEPHLLMMSATPIPRTLAMSYYADLDVSVLDELPPGRSPVTTKLVSEARRDQVVARVHEACRAGGQAYWVCPLIEENEVSAEANASAANLKRSGRSQNAVLQLKAAVETFERLSGDLPDLKIGLVHGRLKAAEKAAVMSAFVTMEIHVLVATTVIEVGVDVPNASLMVIEHAERFGLAQLHQLRGRVGRGAAQSACILLYAQPLGELARARLKIIFESSDGFEIAREDLRLRGPGEFIGARQSGLPLLRYADLQDAALVAQARALADDMLRDAPQQAAAHLQRWLGGREELLKA